MKKTTGPQTGPQSRPSRIDPRIEITGLDPEKDVVARLIMVVDYTELPSSDETTRIIDEGRAYGDVRAANLTIFTTSSRSLL